VKKGKTTPRSEPPPVAGRVDPPPPEMPALDMLDTVAVAATPNPAGGWWISLQATEHVFGAVARRDPRTSAPVPQPLRELLFQLDDEARDAVHPVPVDALFQAVELCARPLAEIVDRHRTRVVREHARVPTHRLREVDAKSVAWLARQPGRTVREKMASGTSVLGVVRRFSPDIPENRVAVALAARLAPRIERRIASARESGAGDKSERDRSRLALLDDVYTTCAERLRRSDLGEVPRAVHLRANNALLSDPVYSRIWRAFRRLHAYEERLPSLWAALPARLRSALFWLVAARVAGLSRVTLYEGIGRASNGEDGRPLGVELLKTTDGPSWSGADDPQLVMRIVSTRGEEARALRLRQTRVGLAADLLRFEGSGILQGKPVATAQYELALALDAHLPRRGVPLTVHGSEVAKGTHWSEAGDMRGLSALAGHIAADLFARARLPTGIAAPSHPESASQSSQPRFGLDLLGAVVRVSSGEENQRLRAEGWVARYALEEDRSEWIAGDVKRLVPLHLRQPTVFALGAVIDPDPREDRKVLRVAARHIADGIAADLGPPPEARLAFTVPDAADDVVQDTLRSAMTTAFPRSLPIWRSVAAVMGWQAAPQSAEASFDGADMQDGDVVLVLDAEAPVLTTSVLLARHDAKLVRLCPETRGFYWERRPSPPRGERDEVLALSTLLEEQGRRVVAAALARNAGVLDDASRAAIVAQLTRLGAIEELLDGGGPLRIPLDDHGQRLLELRHDVKAWGEVLGAWLRGLRDTVRASLEIVRATSLGQRVHFVLVGRPYREREREVRELIAAEARGAPELVGIVVLEADVVAAGAEHCLLRLDAGCRTWTEWLPDLHLEIIRDGHFDELTLLKEQRIEEPILGAARDIAVSGELVLDAGRPFFDFPIISGRAARTPLSSEARLSDPRIPLAQPTPVKLRVRYRYGLDHSYELRFEPVKAEGAPFTSVMAMWRGPEDGSDVLRFADARIPFMAEAWADVGADDLHDLFDLRDQFWRYISNPQQHPWMRQLLHRIWSAGRSLGTAPPEVQLAAKAVIERLCEAAQSDDEAVRDFAHEVLCQFHEDAPKEMIHLQLGAAEQSRMDRERFKGAVRRLAMLTGDGRGDRHRCLARLTSFLCEFTSPSRFDAPNANQTTRALVYALWRHPDLLLSLAEMGPEQVLFLAHTARRTLSNLLNRVPGAVEQRWDRRKLGNFYGLPYRDACELLLALLRLRGDPSLSFLRGGEPLAEQLARYVRLLDGMFARAGVNVPWTRNFPLPVPQPPELARVSGNAWILNVLLTGNEAVHLVRA